MSNELAIATVTAALRNLLMGSIQDELGSGVTTRPPDQARDSGDRNSQINLFLYQTQINTHWRNHHMPAQVRPGETGRSPLALNLYYLMTAYGQDDRDEISAHRLLGRAMQTLHDASTLTASRLRAALPDSDLHDQIERVRITPVAMTLEEISKLWATFQTQYRISAAYEVSVVLIDSNAPTRTPLPVLMRGSDDRGILVQANMLPPCPTLETIELPNKQVNVQGGDRLILNGVKLDSDSGQVQVLFDHFRLDAPIPVVGQSQQNGNAIAVTVPDQPSPWLAGFFTVTVQLQQQDRAETTNTLSVSLAPRIITFAVRGTSDEGEPLLQITCQPEIQKGQQVFALLGNISLPLMVDDVFPEDDSGPTNPPPLPPRTSALRFNLGKVPKGDYWLRLRVDGVDSLLVDRSSNPPTFNPQHRITVP